MRQRPSLLKTNLDHLGLLMKQERTLLLMILTYAVAVGIFSLIIPLTVQELVNTFAFAVSSVMVATLVGIMAVILLLMGVFRILQFYATEMLERRVFVRVTLALAQVLPRFKEAAFRSDSISRFFETVFIQRALSSLLVDLTNVVVGGFIGMTLLAFYHPYFLVFDFGLLGAVGLMVLLGKGGLMTTLHMSEAKYQAFHWFQEVADNLLHFKATSASTLILGKADACATAYVNARQSRFRVLLRQYIGSLSLQVMLHTGLLGTAGWLLGKGELTLGQLVAAEVIVASLLLNLDSVVKRAYLVYYFFTALTELDQLFALPQDKTPKGSALSIPKSGGPGLHLACSQLQWVGLASPSSNPRHFEALPGEKWAFVCPTESTRHRVALALAGLEEPPTGVVRYNGVDIRNISADALNAQRSIVFGRDLTLFEGTVAENILMGRRGLGSEDVFWAVNVVHLEQECEEWPDGVQTMVKARGRAFTPSQRLRMLLARAIITRPRLVILDGALHEIQPPIRETLLEGLCAEDVPWTLVIVTTDATIKTVVPKGLTLS